MMCKDHYCHDACQRILWPDCPLPVIYLCESADPLVVALPLCRYIPFSGGPRKCVGDQFALMEAVIALAVVLKRFDFRMVPDQDIGMTTGATIHTQNGLFMTVKERHQQQQAPVNGKTMTSPQPVTVNA